MRVIDAIVRHYPDIIQNFPSMKVSARVLHREDLHLWKYAAKADGEESPGIMDILE